MGGLEATSEFARLFLAPNVGHCAGGGPAPAGGPTGSAFRALVDWVEGGVAPDHLIGTSGSRTRPLCAYPLFARYNGSGSIDQAQNFGCVKGDTEPPVIHSVTATPSALWPPDQRFVPVTVAVSATDDTDPAPTSRILSVASSEPDSGLFDGDLSPDWWITGPLTVDLRAERDPRGAGRTYTITVEARDASGKTSTSATTLVVVSHDRRR